MNRLIGPALLDAGDNRLDQVEHELPTTINLGTCEQDCAKENTQARSYEISAGKQPLKKRGTL
ncbi:MAG TPA: hypothetical protein VII40_15320 [Xanthobacteraceae bacterium]